MLQTCVPLLLILLALTTISTVQSKSGGAKTKDELLYNIQEGSSTDTIQPTIIIDGEGDELKDFSIFDVKKEEAYLQNAASKGLIAEVKKAMNRGAFIDSVDEKYGYTALMWAAGNGKLEVVQYLLRKGADAHVISFKGDKTALLWAVHNRHLQVIHALLERGVSVDQQNTRGDTPLLAAAYQGNVDIVQLLHKKGASIHHTTSSHGYQALHLAAFRGHTDVAQYLVAHSADVEAVDHSGKNALMLGAMEGHLDIVKLFVKAGVDINAQDMQGNTALILAVHRKHAAVARFLMEQPDCMIHLYNKMNDHVLYIAIKNNQLSIVEDIVLFGLEYVTKASFLDTAISLADAYQYVDIVKFLKQFQASSS